MSIKYEYRTVVNLDIEGYALREAPAGSGWELAHFHQNAGEEHSVALWRRGHEFWVVSSDVQGLERQARQIIQEWRLRDYTHVGCTEANKNPTNSVEALKIAEAYLKGEAPLLWFDQVSPV